MSDQMSGTMSASGLDPEAVLVVLRTLMGRVFGVDPASIDAATTPDEIPRWDSLSMLTVLIGVERKLGVVVPPEALDEVRTTGDVVAVILAHAR